MSDYLRTVTGRITKVSNGTDGRNFYFKQGAEGGELQGQFLDVRNERDEFVTHPLYPGGVDVPFSIHHPNPYFAVQVNELTQAAQTGKEVTLIREKGLFDSYIHQPIVDEDTLVLVHD